MLPWTIRVIVMAPNGQARAHLPQPRQASSSMTIVRSPNKIQLKGQAAMHYGLPHCMQCMGLVTSLVRMMRMRGVKS